MTSQNQRRGRNYIFMGLILIFGAAALFYYAGTLEVMPSAGHEAEELMSRVKMITTGIAGVGCLAIVVGFFTRKRG